MDREEATPAQGQRRGHKSTKCDSKEQQQQSSEDTEHGGASAPLPPTAEKSRTQVSNRRKKTIKDQGGT